MTKNSRKEKVKARKCLLQDFSVNQSFSREKLFEETIEFVGLVDFLNSTFSPHTCNEGLEHNCH